MARAWIVDGSPRSDAELALHEVAALLAAATMGVLRVADAVIEAWPLPGSRARR